MSIAPIANSREGRIIGWASVFLLLAALAFGAVSMAFVMLIHMPDEDVLIALFNTPIFALLAGVIGVVSAKGVRQGRLLWLMRLTVGLTLVCFIVALLTLWRYSLYGGALFHGQPQILGSGAVALAVLVMSGQMLLPQVQSQLLRMSQWFTSAAVAIVGMLILAAILTWPWWEPWEDPIIFVLAIAGLIALGLCALVALLIRSTSKPKRHSNESLPSRIQLRLLCPNCDAEQTLGTGLRRCRSCRFLMNIAIEEPRCECGYLIYKLVGDTCPECGREVTTPHLTLDEAQTPSPMPNPRG